MLIEKLWPKSVERMPTMYRGTSASNRTALGNITDTFADRTAKQPRHTVGGPDFMSGSAVTVTNKIRHKLVKPDPAPVTTRYQSAQPGIKTRTLRRKFVEMQALNRSKS